MPAIVQRNKVLQTLKCSIEAAGLLIDRRILAAVEDLDTAVVLEVVLWVEAATRSPGKALDTIVAWELPRGNAQFSHWFAFNYASIIEILERSISKIRLRSALKYLVQDLSILEARRKRDQFPTCVEYRLDFDQLSRWMSLPRPEDLDVFQRSRPQKRKFVMPKLHPVTGKVHGWHDREASTNIDVKAEVSKVPGEKV